MTPLTEELKALFAERNDALVRTCAAKGSNDRVDSLTLLCREVLRASSLCLVDGEMHHFSGRVYSPCPRSTVSTVLGNILVDMGVSPTDVRKMADMPLGVIHEKSYSKGPYIAFVNGTLDYTSQSFIPSDRGVPKGWVVTESLPYEYVDPLDMDSGRWETERLCPKWMSFLEQVMPDPSMRAVLQEFFGCCYVDRSRLSVEKFAIFLGSGANGKSVIREVVSRTIGRDNVASFDAEQITRSELQPYLNGKRINFASDMKATAAFDSALKALASGQDVVGRKIYGEPVTVKAPPIVFSMNQLPPFRDTSDAFFRRVLLFRFDVVIPEERRDASLAEKICSRELPGIFDWIMDGRRRLEMNRGRFSPCPAMDSALASLRGTVPEAKYPAKAYLEGRGYSLVPSHEGQDHVLVSQAEIERGLKSTVSRHRITAELKAFGVETFRSKELFYKVYHKER